jgi:hypothetical protein
MNFACPSDPLYRHSMGPKRQMAICVICMKPILEGDGVREVAPPQAARTRTAHARCAEPDWERIEEGLEPLPLLTRSRKR